MNTPTPPDAAPNTPPPPIEIDASQIEVLPADGSSADGSPSAPLKEAKIRTEETAPKTIPAGKVVQFYRQLTKSTRVRSIAFTTGAKLARLVAGAVEHKFGEGETWESVFPGGLTLPAVAGGIFLTAALRNDTDADIMASAAFELEELADDEQPMPTAPQGAGGRRRGPAQAPPGARARKTPREIAGGAPHRTSVVRTGAVRTGPPSDGQAPRGVRRGQPQIGPLATRTSHPHRSSSLSPTESAKKRVAPARDFEPLPEPGEDEIMIRVEGWRLPALRDLAKKGVPLPPGHVAAVQNALRKRGQSPGVPLVIGIDLADRLLLSLSKGIRLSSEERDKLASCLAGAEGKSAESAPAEVKP